MEQHIPLGMVMALNVRAPLSLSHPHSLLTPCSPTCKQVLPSKQNPIPADVPTEGPCPVWSSTSGQAVDGDAAATKAIVQVWLGGLVTRRRLSPVPWPPG